MYTIYTITVNEKRGHKFQGEKGGGGYGTVWWEEKEEENVIL